MISQNFTGAGRTEFDTRPAADWEQSKNSPQINGPPGISSISSVGGRELNNYKWICIRLCSFCLFESQEALSFGVMSWVYWGDRFSTMLYV